MKHAFIISIITLIICCFVSCKKGYTCACSTESGFYDGFDIHDSKKRAQKKCQDYQRTQYDTAFVSNVKCELKKGE